MSLFKYILVIVVTYLFSYFTIAPFAVAKDIIILNQPASANDMRYHYSYELMQLILENTEDDFGEWEITHSPIFMTRDRILTEMVDGELINVIAEAIKPAWNEKLIPIRVPIRKGIQGFRVFIIKKQTQAQFSKIKTIEQLKQIPTGSGIHWSTRLAFEKAGFDVVVGSSYDGLFHMLDKGRFESFGRGVNEAPAELSSFKVKFTDLVLDENVLLHIPLATFFYVSPDEPQLAKRIEVGIKRIMANGQFDNTFYRQYCQELISSKLSERRIFSIENPLMDPKLLAEMQQANYLLSPYTHFDEVCSGYLP
ncbi:hypothetical protein [Shewanella japonica]|uniref:hypothetical protein n=1 Tax=Shewanella japonica TaxID=93973 RepID=UPI002494764F|nr:hypothetical protein [Shewanella japonica]